MNTFKEFRDKFLDYVRKDFGIALILESAPPMKTVEVSSEIALTTPTSN